MSNWSEPPMTDADAARVAKHEAMHWAALPDYNPADEAEVARRNRQEEAGVWMVVAGLVLMLGSMLGLAVSVAVNWLFGV